MSKIFRNINIVDFLVIFAICLFVSIFSLLGIIRSYNSRIVDELHFFDTESPREEILIVEIDDKTLAEIGAWPWDRSMFAELIEKVEDYEARVIGFDIIFLEERSGDTKLRKSINESEIPVILASKLDDNGVFGGVFRDSKVNYAYVNLKTDFDGKIREAMPFVESNGACTPSFSFGLFYSYLNGSKEVGCDGLDEFLDGRYSSEHLKFRYTNSDFKRIKYEDIVLDRVDPNIFLNKIVLVGSTAKDLKTSLNDNFISIDGKATPGIFIHANILNSFLEGSFQRDISFWILTLAFTIWGGVFYLVLRAFRKIYTTVLFLFLALLFGNFLGIILFEYELNFDFISFNLISIAIFIFEIIKKFVIERGKKRFIRKAFGQYIHPKLVAEIMQNPKLLNLGGEKKRVTLMFADVAGFTTLSEKVTPEELVELLNSLFDRISKIILDHNGTIDKFIGDEIMAFWNAPVQIDGHEELSVITANKILEEVDNWNSEYSKYPDVEMRVGLNAGEVIVGNIGSSSRFDYTALGDDVNIAARIQGLGKKYDTNFLFSESVRSKIKESDLGYLVREVDEILVKGKTLPVKIFDTFPDTKENREVVKNYEDGFKIYKNGNFKKALSYFSQNTKDAVSKVMISRIEELKESKPDNWDGVWKWDSK